MKYAATYNGKTFYRNSSYYEMRVVLFVDGKPVKWGTMKDSKMEALENSAKQAGKSTAIVNARWAAAK